VYEIRTIDFSSAALKPVIIVCAGVAATAIATSPEAFNRHF